jgi:hypothetical protein
MSDRMFLAKLRVEEKRRARERLAASSATIDPELGHGFSGTPHGWRRPQTTNAYSIHGNTNRYTTMALPLRPRAIPQCTACIRSYASATLGDAASPVPSAFRQQVRGKKKLVNTSSTIPVRLLRDVKMWGKEGMDSALHVKST